MRTRPYLGNAPLVVAPPLRRVPRLSLRVAVDASRAKGFVGVGLTWVVNFETFGLGLTIGVLTFSAVWLRQRRGLVPAVLAFRDRFNLAAGLVALLIAAVFAVLFIGCGRAEAQAGTLPTIPLPAGAVTDCGPSNGRYTLRRDVQAGDLASLRLRYGPCLGRSDSECSDHGGRCIVTEAERQQIIAWWVWKQAGCGTAVVTAFTGSRLAPSITFPDEQSISDAGLALGVASRLRAEYEAACLVRPTPAPTTPPPSPTVAPPVTPPTPRVEPTPAATPCPACPPPVECEACPTFERVEEPAEVRATIEAGLNALGRRWRAKVAAAKAWRREHPGPHYALVSSALIQQTLESVEWRCYPVDGGEECLAADALPGEVPMFVPRSPFAVAVRRCAP